MKVVTAQGSCSYTTLGRLVAISHPIDGDSALDDVFVQFLGKPSFDDCCLRSRAWDGVDARNLSTAERLAIWVYTTDFSRWYLQINAELWGGTPSTAVSNFARILNNALQKLPQHVGAVYRGYESKRLSADFAKYPVGAVVEWPGFTSSTTDEDMAYDGNMLFTILSRTGRILGSYSDIPREQEVTFRTGTKFRVLRAEQIGSDVVIEMEEVEEDTR